MDVKQRQQLSTLTWAQFHGLHRDISAILAGRLEAAEGITLAEYDMLMQFVDQKCTGHRMADLAQRIGVSPSTATRLVTRLEAKGVLQRCPSPEDGRGVRAERTPAGTRLLRRASCLADAVVAEYLSAADQ